MSKSTIRTRRDGLRQPALRMLSIGAAALLMSCQGNLPLSPDQLGAIRDIVLNPQPQPAPEEPGTCTKPALVGYWSFDEKSGPTVVDMSDNGHNGTILNATRASGALGFGLLCKGLGSGVDIADGPDFEISGSLSITTWIRVDEQPDYHTLIFFRGDNRPGLDPYTLTIYPDGRLWFQIQDERNSTDTVTAMVPRNKLIHVAGVFDVKQKSLALYVDGNLVAQKTTSMAPFARLSAEAGPGVGIGHHATRTGGDYGFAGLIDEVKLFSGALDAQDVKNEYRRVSH